MSKITHNPIPVTLLTNQPFWQPKVCPFTHCKLIKCKWMKPYLNIDNILYYLYIFQLSIFNNKMISQVVFLIRWITWRKLQDTCRWWDFVNWKSIYLLVFCDSVGLLAQLYWVQVSCWIKHCAYYCRTCCQNLLHINK